MRLPAVCRSGPVPGMPDGVLPQAAPASQQRVQVVEEPTMRLGGPTYKNVQPKTYQVLEEELPANNANAGEWCAGPAADASRPLGLGREQPIGEMKRFQKQAPIP